MKGAWSLVNAAYSVARAQADLDKTIEALIKTMDDGCKLAKDYAPLKGRKPGTDSIAEEILKEVIVGASLIRVYCEKRPKSTYSATNPQSCLSTFTHTLLELSALRTLSSNLAQEVDECSLVLSALMQKLVARAGMQAFNQIDHIAAAVDHVAAMTDKSGEAVLFYSTISPH